MQSMTKNSSQVIAKMQTWYWSGHTGNSILWEKGKKQNNDCLFFSELMLGKAIVAYTKPQQRKKEESERLRGEGDKVKFIYIQF